MSSGKEKPGKVYLVGAGPGDPGLLTLRAAECLSQADVVLYDYLVNPLVLEHAPAAAQRVCLGHHGTGRHVSQDEINAQMIEAARQGKTVVRLKAGDPCVFGCLAEEVGALGAAGIPLEIIPGVTAGLAVAGYAEIPITHGQSASAVALVTGHQRREKAQPPLDYAALAAFPGTLIFYMGVTSAAEWSAALIAGGRAADTPVAIVRRCTWADQETFRSTLATVAEAVAAQKIRPPAIFVVGEVVNLAPATSWFAARPLCGVRVLVTRPGEQVHDLRDRLSALGAEVLAQPGIEIGPPPDWAPVDAALGRLDRYDWLVFSSGNGVRYLLDRLLALGGDLRRLGGLKLAAIGPGTAAELAAYHLKADLVPAEYRAEALAESLLHAGAPGTRFLLARADRGRQVLPERLAAAGAAVDQIVVYSTVEATHADAEVLAALEEGRIDWVTVTSSAIARSLAALFGRGLGRSRLASISPVTSAVLRGLGYQPSAEAAEYTMAGLVAAIVAAEGEGGRR
ncbi:MAG: uroporphyrinogen-III C-methyltransferase [Thermoguttaceae bacterium]